MGCWRGVSSGQSSASAVALGPNGSVYITGVHDGSITFDNISSNNIHVYPDGLFVAKFSSSGQIQWINTLSTGSLSIGGLDLIVDSIGDAYVAGYQTSGYSGYVAKIDRNGTWLYGTDNRYEIGGSAAVGLALDASGFVYVSFTEWHTGQGLTKVKKLNSSNLQVIWSKNVYSGSSLTTYGVCADQPGTCRFGGGITIDDYGEIFITGSTKISTNGGWIPYLSLIHI